MRVMKKIFVSFSLVLMFLGNFLVFVPRAYADDFYFWPDPTHKTESRPYPFRFVDKDLSTIRHNSSDTNSDHDFKRMYDINADTYGTSFIGNWEEGGKEPLKSEFGGKYFDIENTSYAVFRGPEERRNNPVQNNREEFYQYFIVIPKDKYDILKGGGALPFGQDSKRATVQGQLINRYDVIRWGPIPNLHYVESSAIEIGYEDFYPEQFYNYHQIDGPDKINEEFVGAANSATNVYVQQEGKDDNLFIGPDGGGWGLQIIKLDAGNKTSGQKCYRQTNGTDALCKTISIRFAPGSTFQVGGGLYIKSISPGNEIMATIPIKVTDMTSNTTQELTSTARYSLTANANTEYKVEVNTTYEELGESIIKEFADKLQKELGAGTTITGSTTFKVSQYGSIAEGTPDILLNVTTVNVVDAAIKGALISVVEGLDTTKTALAGWISKILISGNDIGNDLENKNSGLVKASNQVRNLALSLITLAILIIAFMNILSIDLEKYGINRMIPRLILGIGYTYLSFLIARFLLELASAFQSKLLSGVGTSGTLGGSYAYANLASNLNVGQIIFLIILAVGTIIAMFWLCLLLVVRIFVIWFLVAIAPIAFILYVMPFTQSLFMKWWSTWWKWLFMGPIVAFLLWLGEIFINSAGIAGKATTPTSGVIDDSWILLILSAVSVFLAASIPMALGGNVYSALKNAALKAGKMSKYVPGVGKAQRAIKNRLDLRRKTRDQREQFAVQKQQAQIAGWGGGKGVAGWAGRRVSGMNRKQAEAAQGLLVAQRAKEIEDGGINFDTAHERYATAKGVERQALAQVIAKNKWVKTDTTNDGAKMFMKKFNEDLEGSPALENLVSANNPELYSSLRTLGYSRTDKWANLEGLFHGKAIANTSNLKVPQIDRMSAAELKTVLGSKDKLRTFMQSAGEKDIAAMQKRYSELGADVKGIDSEHEGILGNLLGRVVESQGNRVQTATTGNPPQSGQSQTTNPTPPGVNPDNYEQSDSGLWTPKK